MSCMFCRACLLVTETMKHISINCIPRTIQLPHLRAWHKPLWTIATMTPVLVWQLLTSRANIVLTHCTVMYWLSLVLNMRRLIQDVLSSEKAVYVGDVTFDWNFFSSAIIYGCSPLFMCLIPPFIQIRPSSGTFSGALVETDEWIGCFN